MNEYFSLIEFILCLVCLGFGCWEFQIEHKEIKNVQISTEHIWVCVCVYAYICHNGVRSFDLVVWLWFHVFALLYITFGCFWLKVELLDIVSKMKVTTHYMRCTILCTLLFAVVFYYCTAQMHFDCIVCAMCDTTEIPSISEAIVIYVMCK